MFAKVEEWKQSGISLREFASSIGLSTSAFEYWVRKKRASSIKGASFVELTHQIKPMEIINVPSSSPKQPAPRQASIVITFAGGMRVNIYG